MTLIKIFDLLLVPLYFILATLDLNLFKIKKPKGETK